MTSRREGNILPFIKPGYVGQPPKDVCNMTAEEILEHLKGRFSHEIVVLAFHDNHLLEINTNATLERTNWMLDRGKAMILDDRYQ